MQRTKRDEGGIQKMNKQQTAQINYLEMGHKRDKQTAKSLWQDIFRCGIKLKDGSLRILPQDVDRFVKEWLK
jgi:hypothetical protein